jgi:hypothetical protein
MIELDSNVVEFNKFVKAQVTALAHRDQESSDLLINLFKGYEAADDVEFRDLVSSYCSRRATQVIPKDAQASSWW